MTGIFRRNLIERVKFCEGILLDFGVYAEVDSVFGVWGVAGLVQDPVLVRGCFGPFGGYVRGFDKALIDYRSSD